MEHERNGKDAQIARSAAEPLPEYALLQIAGGEWDKAGKVHDWRNHVPEEIRAMWFEFTQAQREALYRWAYELAGREEWE